MAENSITVLMVAMIFCCSLSGCIDNSSQELALELSDLENENEQLNNTITTLRMENEQSNNT